jgi:capsular exopolysaccharide synthesis family protein
MDIKYYLSVFLRRWWILVITTVLVTGVTAVRAGKEPITYTAQARLLYEANSVASSVLGGSMYMPMSWNNPVDTQIQLITTRPNIEEVIKRLGLNDPAKGHVMIPEEVLGGLSAEVDKNTDIILLRYATMTPDLAVNVVNEMGRVFVERNRNYHQETARAARQFITEQLAKTEKGLQEAEDELRNFRESNGVFDIGGLGNATSSQLSNIDSSLINMEVDRKVAEEKLNIAREHLQVTDPGLLQRMEKLKADQVYANLQGALASGEAALTVKRTQFTEDAPEVVDAKNQLAKLRQAVQTRVKHVLGRGLDDQDLISQQTPTEQRFLGDLVDAQTEMSMLDARANALKSSRSEYESRFSALPAKDQQLAQLQRRKAAAEETYQVFLKREQEMRITEAMNLGNVRVIEEATQAIPSASTYSRTVSLAALLGLIFGLGVALLVEFLDDRIRRPEEAQNVLELPILGMLPWVEGREAAKRRLVVLEDPRSPVTESYRALQTYTRMVEPDSRHQCFMLTSPGPKEGKSTVLANLAITSAQLGKRTLIVDTDLRAPSQHINFDRQNLMGIYDVVYEGCPLEEAIQRTDVEGLDILTTGPVPPDPVQTLHSEAFKRMVDRLRRDYDAIFFDAPPINLFTDAAVLGRMADSVLLVVDVRSTTRQATVTAKELLMKAKVPLAGMVVKNTAAVPSRYHNRYYERYYMDRLKQMADD